MARSGHGAHRRARSAPRCRLHDQRAGRHGVGALIAGFYGRWGWICPGSEAGLGVRSGHLLAWSVSDGCRHCRTVISTGPRHSIVCRPARARFVRHDASACRASASSLSISFPTVKSSVTAVHRSSGSRTRFGCHRRAGAVPAWNCVGQQAPTSSSMRHPGPAADGRDFPAPFQPAQVLVIDVSSQLSHQRDQARSPCSGHVFHTCRSTASRSIR